MAEGGCYAEIVFHVLWPPQIWAIMAAVSISHCPNSSMGTVCLLITIRTGQEVTSLSELKQGHAHNHFPFHLRVNSSAPLRKSVKKSISQFLQMKTIFRWSQSPFNQSPPLKIITFSMVRFYNAHIQTFDLGNNIKSNVSLLWYFGIYFWCFNSKVVVDLKLDTLNLESCMSSKWPIILINQRVLIIDQLLHAQTYL